MEDDACQMQQEWKLLKALMIGLCSRGNLTGFLVLSCWSLVYRKQNLKQKIAPTSLLSSPKLSSNTTFLFQQEWQSFLETKNHIVSSHLNYHVIFSLNVCFHLFPQRHVSVWTVEPQPPHCGEGMALATIFAMLVGSTTRWMARIGPSFDPRNAW